MSIVRKWGTGCHSIVKSPSAFLSQCNYQIVQGGLSLGLPSQVNPINSLLCCLPPKNCSVLKQSRLKESSWTCTHCHKGSEPLEAPSFIIFKIVLTILHITLDHIKNHNITNSVEAPSWCLSGCQEVLFSVMAQSPLLSIKIRQPLIYHQGPLLACPFSALQTLLV